MSKFSDKARRLAAAAKRAGVLEPKEVSEPVEPEETPVRLGGQTNTLSPPLTEPITEVPLDRKYRPINQLSDDELTKARVQAQKRLDREKRPGPKRDKARGILEAIERTIELRTPEELPPPPPLRIVRDFERDDGPVPTAAGPSTGDDAAGLRQSQRAAGVNFGPVPGDTPESPL